MNQTWFSYRELHWHPTEDEWTYFLEGQGRVTLFASNSNAVTFNYMAGDVAYIPATYGHYIENTGNSTLKFLEIWNTSKLFELVLCGLTLTVAVTRYDSRHQLGSMVGSDAGWYGTGSPGASR